MADWIPSATRAPEALSSRPRACWEEGPASYRGLRTGNAALVAGAGVIYVYRSYGLFWCLSLVSQAGSAILIRVIEPTHGLA